MQIVVVSDRLLSSEALVRELVAHGAGQAVGGHMATAVTGGKQRPWQQAPAQLAELSCREHEVFVLLGLGLSNQRIARRLGSTEQTVR